MQSLLEWDGSEAFDDSNKCPFHSFHYLSRLFDEFRLPFSARD